MKIGTKEQLDFSIAVEDWQAAATMAVNSLPKKLIEEFKNEEKFEASVDRVASIAYTYFLTKRVLPTKKAFDCFLSEQRKNGCHLRQAMKIMQEELDDLIARSEFNKLKHDDEFHELRSSIEVAIKALRWKRTLIHRELCILESFHQLPRTSDNPKLHSMIDQLVRYYAHLTKTPLYKLKASATENPKRGLMAFLVPVIDQVGEGLGNEITTRQLHNTHVRPLINQYKTACKIDRTQSVN